MESALSSSSLSLRSCLINRGQINVNKRSRVLFLLSSRPPRSEGIMKKIAVVPTYPLFSFPPWGFSVQRDIGGLKDSKVFSSFPFSFLFFMYLDKEED